MLYPYIFIVSQLYTYILHRIHVFFWVAIIPFLLIPWSRSEFYESYWYPCCKASLWGRNGLGGGLDGKMSLLGRYSLMGFNWELYEIRFNTCFMNGPQIRDLDLPHTAPSFKSWSPYIWFHSHKDALNIDNHSSHMLSLSEYVCVLDSLSICQYVHRWVVSYVHSYLPSKVCSCMQIAYTSMFMHCIYIHIHTYIIYIYIYAHRCMSYVICAIPIKK